MAQVQEFHFNSSTGKNSIRALRWLPDDGAPKAVLQLSHGVAEYIDRYDEFAQFLAGNGFAVVGNDHLGHGKTVTDPADKGFFAEEDGWKHVVADMHKLHVMERGRFPGVPYFLLGHSMGSFLARTYLIDYPGELSGCVVSGTGWQPKLTCELGLLIARNEAKKLGPRAKSDKVNNLFFGKYNDRFKPARTTHDWLSRNTENVDRYVADPDCGFVPSVELFIEMIGGMEYIEDPRNLAKMDKKTPVYFFSGSDDPVGSYGKGFRSAVAAFRRAGCTDVTEKLYEGGRHEMLNETNRSEVRSDVLAWLTAHI